MKKTAASESLKKYIRNIPDFPKKGILFKDITPLLLNAAQFKKAIGFFKKTTKAKIDYVVSVESRGFIFGSALAYALGAGFVPIRKAGKLPFKKYSKSYDLEYGQATVEIHADAIRRGSRVILVDDVLATGGTIEAAAHLLGHFGCRLESVCFLVELEFLGGRARLKHLPIRSIIKY